MCSCIKPGAYGDWFVKDQTRKYRMYLNGRGPWVWKIKDVLEVNPIRRNELVLDLGCGVGTFAFEHEKRGARATGLDYSKKAIHGAKRLSREYHVYPNLVLASATNLPFKDYTFDRIVSADLIEHLVNKDLSKCMTECHRTLRRRGLLIIHTAPGKGYLFLHSLRMTLHLIVKGTYWKKYIQEHPSLQTPRSLGKKLLKSGFRTIRTWGLLNLDVTRTSYGVILKALKIVDSEGAFRSKKAEFLASNVFALAKK